MSEQENERTNYARISIDLVDDDPFQPRTAFEEEGLREFAMSVRENDVIEPIHVVRRGNRYGLLNGARRLRACKLAGRKDVPALIVSDSSSEGERLLKQLLSNAHRLDLNPMELCDAYQRLMQTFGINASELALKVAKSKTYVSNVLSLASLSDDAKSLIREGKLDLAKGAQLARVPPEQLDEFLQKARRGELKRAELEQAASTRPKRGKRENGSRPQTSRVTLEAAKASVNLVCPGKPTLEDVIRTLQELVRSCKRAQGEGLDLSTLASVLRDKGRKVRDAGMADERPP